VNQKRIVIHSDGGARGNPGPGACAYIIEADGKILQKAGKYLGEVTNNIAEYGGVIEALKWLSSNKKVFENSDGPTEFFLDSELVTKQINGEYKVKDKKLKILFSEAKELLENLQLKILFISIPRSKNREADLIVNRELDRNV
jgi:ribonuclease HI